MGRAPRVDVGGEIYHVLNRGNNRAALFYSDRDYQDFEKILFDKLEEVGVICHAYALMPNHWHLMLKTYEDGALAHCMKLVTQSHAQLVRLRTKTIGNGHLYQNRYKSFIIDTDTYFHSALKYIERNPVRAGLCKKPEDWRWGSVYHRINMTSRLNLLNADLPMNLPSNYAQWINEPTSNAELEKVRSAVSDKRKSIAAIAK